MIITIQPLKKGYEISLVDTFTFPNMNQYEISREADKISELASSSKTKPRPVIKWLPIESTPVMRINPGFVKEVDAIINSHTPMAMKKEINMKNNPYEFGFMKGYEAGRESYRIQMQLEDVTNYNQPMAMKSKTYPAKPVKAVAKKKVVKKGKKK